jgi:hypothetical protein
MTKPITHHKGTTSNMQQHCERKHASLWEQAQKGEYEARLSHTTVTLHQTLNRTGPLTQDALKRAIVRHEVMDTVPLNQSSSPWLRQLLVLAGCRINIPSREPVRRFLVQYYQEEKDKLKAILARVSNKVHLTIDCWSSRNLKAFMSVTATWMTEGEWTIQDVLLDFRPLEGSHAAEFLLAELIAVLDDWDLHKKLGCITTDNAKENPRMCRLYEEARAAGLEPWSAGLDFWSASECHMRCLAHVINLACKDVMTDPAVASVLNKVNSNVSAIKRTPRRLNSYKAVCAAQVPPVKFEVMTRATETRWNSAHVLFVQFLQAKRAIKAWNANELQSNYEDENG